MATFVWKNVCFLLDEFNLTGFTNQVTLTADMNMLDDTVFKDATRSNKAGLRAYALGISGFWDSDVANLAPDPVLFNARGAATPSVFSVHHAGIVVGDTSYFGTGPVAAYNIGASVGDLLGYSADIPSADDLIRATTMSDDTSRAASFATPKRQIGAVAADESMHAIWQVVEFTGTTLDADVRSDADNSAGGETIRGAFTTLTAEGAQRIKIAGAVTDTWWDIDFTFVGTSFTAVTAVGVF